MSGLYYYYYNSLKKYSTFKPGAKTGEYFLYLAVFHLSDVAMFWFAAVIQLMAAAKARRGLAFFTFGDHDLCRRLQQTYHLLVTQKMTVGETFHDRKPSWEF